MTADEVEVLFKHTKRLRLGRFVEHQHQDSAQPGPQRNGQYNLPIMALGRAAGETIRSDFDVSGDSRLDLPKKSNEAVRDVNHSKYVSLTDNQLQKMVLSATSPGSDTGKALFKWL